jgi:serine/threonine-protein kinase
VSAPRRFGPFILDSRIAVGGTAEVYLAHPATPTPELPPKLVVKRLLPHFAGDPDGRTMFQREARLHAAVTHENVVTVFHAGKDERGEPYLAMEFIDGVDGYRLLRKLRQDGEFLPIGVAVYIAREILRALESVHAARDPESGGALGIVHRDVSPSNIYLSKDGTVKLGDFGIARSTTRATLRSEAGHVLKGKFAYLTPEQVAGEASDHRADLFSLATVLVEMLLNKPLFPGGGQLAILLAIRDCKIDALLEIKPRLPPGLFEVMEKALARQPVNRYPDAAAFADALAPFEADKRLAQKEIAARVRWVRAATSSTDRLVAQRDSAAMRAVTVDAPRVPSAKIQAQRPSQEQKRILITREEAPVIRTARAEQKTSEYQFLPSRVLKRDGTELGPWEFARLMEALATGQVERGDRVDFVGRGFRLVEEMEEFARFFPAPPPTGTTAQIKGAGTPDLKDQIGAETILKVLMLVLAQRETGVLFAERPQLPPGPHDDAPSRGGRKELYFVSGKLHHVASSNAQELLGEYLVRRGKLGREELDLALAVLPRYSGRMGDTLISMGLVGPVDIFRAIRDQGRDRVADLFLWNDGQLTFYRGHTAPHVEFPLDLELPALMLAGLETAKPGETIVNEYRSRIDHMLAPTPPSDDLFAFEAVIWPPAVTSVRELLRRPTRLRELLQYAQKHRNFPPGDTLRAVEILIAAGLIEWR